MSSHVFVNINGLWEANLHQNSSEGAAVTPFGWSFLDDIEKKFTSVCNVNGLNL